MSGLNTDDIIRKFLELHPDTPIDGQKYAIPLRIISRMLEVAAATEREACAESCNRWIINRYDINLLPQAIRGRGQE